MKIDTTLYEVYSELGLLEIMQSVEAERFIDALCDDATEVENYIAA
jgi:hypothetical protein